MLKLSYIIVLSGILASSSVEGASVVAATTGSGVVVSSGNARAIYDLSGNAILKTTGYIGVGYFTSLPTFASTSASVIDSSFNRLGSSGIFGVNIGGGNIANGLFSTNATGNISLSENSGFIGKNISVVIGNGSSITNSTNLLVLQSSTVFAVDAPTFSANLALQTTPTAFSVLYGSDAFNGSTSGIITVGPTTYNGATNSYQMAALIPEPTSFLLTALGVFGFILRRRR